MMMMKIAGLVWARAMKKSDVDVGRNRAEGSYKVQNLLYPLETQFLATLAKVVLHAATTSGYRSHIKIVSKRQKLKMLLVVFGW